MGEVKRKASGFSAVVGNEALKERSRPEAIPAQFGFAELHGVGFAFVDSERVDQREDGGNVGFSREADVHGGSSRHRV